MSKIGKPVADSKMCMKSKGPRMFKTILKENKVGGLTLPDFHTQYKATI